MSDTRILNTIARMEACPPGTIVRALIPGEVEPMVAFKSCEPLTEGWWWLDSKAYDASTLYALAVGRWRVVYSPAKATWEEALTEAARDAQEDQITALLSEQWHDSVCGCRAWRTDSDDPGKGCVNTARPPTSWPVGDVLGVLRTVAEGGRQ